MDQAAHRTLRWTRIGALVALVGVLAAYAAVEPLRSYTVDWVQDRRGTPPLEVDVRVVETVYGRYWASETVVDVPSEAALDEIQRQGGALVGYSRQELTLQTRRDATLYVTGIEPVEIQRRPPLAGTLFAVQPQGELENSELRLRLDAVRPVLLDQDGERPFFVGKHISLGRGEIHVVNVQSETLRCFCTWRLQISYRYRGTTRTLLVPPAGSDPFRMTGPVRPENYGAQYVYSFTENGVERFDCAATKKRCAETPVPDPPAV